MYRIITFSLLGLGFGVAYPTSSLDRVGRGRGFIRDANDNRIVNGEDAVEDKYPWVVALDAMIKGDASTYSCGGSLIAPGYVLSAAHCFYPTRSGTSGKAYFGSHKTCFYGDCEAEERTIVKVLVHPDYNDKTSQNDIAILKLNKPINGITPVPLRKYAYAASEDFGNHDEALALGWGTINTKTEEMADVLQQGAVNMVNRNDCWKKHSYSKKEILPGMVCAKHPKGTDACQGDSGGPLFVPSTGEQVGIVSWGEGCGLKKFPGVYADVGYYHDWISGIVDFNKDNETIPTTKATTITTVISASTANPETTVTEAPTTGDDSTDGKACVCKSKWSYNPDDSGYTTFSGCASTSGDGKDHWCYTEGDCIGSTPSQLFNGWHWASCTPESSDNTDEIFCASIWNRKKCIKKTNGKCKWTSGVCMAKPKSGTCAAMRGKKCKNGVTDEGSRCQWYANECKDALICEKGSHKCCGKSKKSCQKDSQCEFSRGKTCMPIPDIDDSYAYSFEYGYY